MKFALKRGDDVVVLAGDDKGKSGKVLQVLRNKMRVVVEGVALYKKCIKKSQENSIGGIIEKEGSVHYSNLMLKSKFDAGKAGQVK